MAPQPLPFDILLLILDVAPRPTVAKMTQTCHTLREGGARFLLNGVVSLTSGDSIISFARFLDADAVNRFQHLRALELACRTIPPQAVDALLGLISHPSLALDSLTLQDGHESVLDSPPSPSSDVIHAARQSPLVTAFAELTTIRHLTVHGHCGRAACSLLQVLHSPLKTVSLDFPPLRRTLRGDDLRRRNPILTLANHSDTLEEISVSHLAMLPWEDQGPFDTVYPSVRTINASFSLFIPPWTLPFIAAFPNLRRLALPPAIHSPLLGPRIDASSRLKHAMSLRHCQRALQQTHTPRKTWTELEELEGSLADILALGLLSCHVPMLRLTGILSDSPEYERVNIVLKDTQPAGLAITVACASTFRDTMGPVFGNPSAQQLRVLELELVFSASEGDVDVQAILNDVATTLALLPLHHVTLTLNYGLFAVPEQPYRLQNGCSCPVHRDIESLDVVAARTLFRAAIPSLETDAVVRVSMDRPPHTG